VELGRPNPSQHHRGGRFYATVTSHVRLLPDPCITINNLPAIYPNDYHFNCPNTFLPLTKSQLRNFVPYVRLLIIVCSQVMPLLYARFISIDCFASSTSRRRTGTRPGLGSLMQDLKYLVRAGDTVLRRTASGLVSFISV
jgi:hypothetical protein